MSSFSSFKPFLIGSGKSETGLFQYYESWIKPEDAFDDIQDAYVNRGQIWKREGQTLLGRLKYCTTQVLAYADGSVGPYTGFMDNIVNTPRGGHLPIVAGSVVVRTRHVVGSITEIYSDNGIGGLTGNLGGVGTINYTTGQWSILSLIALRTSRPIMITYDFEPTTASNPHMNVSVVAIGTGAAGPYSGTFTQNLPMKPNTVFIVALQSNGEETYQDNGASVFVGSLGGSGTINYSTGAWTFQPAGGNTVLVESAIQVGFISDNQNITLFTIGTGDGLAGAHTGTFTQVTPLVAGTISIIAVQSNGTENYTDTGLGTLLGSLGGTGTINYTTGAWSFTPAGGATVTAASNIQLGISANNLFAIMGINQWNDETNNTFKLTVEDTRRLSVFNQPNNTFDGVCEVAETLFILPSAVTPQTFMNFSATVGSYKATFPLIAPLSMVFTLINPVTGAEMDRTNDNGAGTIAGSVFFESTVGNEGTVDYYTGDITVNLTGALVSGWAVNVTFTLQNDYFFGDTSNFFNWTNWFYPTNLIPIADQIIDTTVTPNVVVRPTQFHDGFLYLTNNFDPITLFNGTTLSRPAFAIQQRQLGLGKNEITKCLDIKTYSSRLIFIRPSTTLNNYLPDPQSIRWSAQFQPTNTVADIPGSGGELSAATSDWIQSAKFLKDFLVISFQNSHWNFRFTGNAFNPFVFFKIDSTKTTNAPYASLEYEDRITDIGTKGFNYCDGNSVDRYDVKVFDLYDDVNSEVFKQCFAMRFDALNQAWMVYPDMDNNDLLSSKIFLWNYMEDSWSVFNEPLSCLGLGFGIRDLTWAMMNTTTWAQSKDAWNSYLEQKESLRLLGGGHQGLVLQLNDGVTDVGVPINMQFTSKKYNPFSDQGMKASFGYLDIYYTVNPRVTLTFDFFLDNNTAVAFTRQITLTGNPNNPNTNYSWQRLFINVQAQFLQYKCSDDGVGGFRILGQLLWASPAGRLIQ